MGGDRHRLRGLMSGLAVPLTLLGGCGGDDAPAPPEPRPVADRPSGGPVPPDAGTAHGHGADRTQVAVPRSPAGPPSATVEVAPADADAGAALVRASVGEGPHREVVRLGEPRLRAATAGDDRTDGVARVRVSVVERITCRDSRGRPFVRRRTRYFPPPQVERVRSAPGTRLPARRARSLVVALAGTRCGVRADATAVDGEVWGEAINGSGLEAVTGRVRFRYRAGANG